MDAPGKYANPNVPPSTETLPESGRTPPIPKQIGHYHLKRVLASGGMGTVYEATQESPRRVVAIKVMRHGIASRSAMRRFEYESQLLARLRHPGIAQIYEAGTHDDPAAPGHPVPFFAMEYIPNARPITQYADEKKLGTRQRMELFAQVCDAVHHGHQKGIIHRDLKPANILVDSYGVVKVIDFGVARGTDSDMAVTTLQTDIGQLVGTLQYMSPEQCEGDPHDIDTRSDVYALGVVFYQLLSGKLPYDVSRSKIFDGTRMIREQEPDRLSSTSAELRGDVETIVFKALEKDRERRYQSAVELLQDIRRYLAGEAIVARPPSIVYQLRVFARRNKGLFTAIAAVFVVLVGATIVSTSLYWKAQSERDRAQAVTKYLTGILASADPQEAPRPNLTVRELVDKAGIEVPSMFRDQPLTEAALRTTIGRIYISQGRTRDAEPHIKAAAAIRERELPPNHPDRAQSLHDTAQVLVSLRKDPKDFSAEPLIREALEIRRKVLGNEHPDVLESMWLLGLVQFRTRDFATLEPMWRERVDICKNLYGYEHRKTADAMQDLACVLWEKGDIVSAEKLFREALLILQKVGASEHYYAMSPHLNLGVLLCNKGEFQEGEEMIRQAIGIQDALYGIESPMTASALSQLAECLTAMGKYEEAEREFLKGYRLVEANRDYARTAVYVLEKIVAFYPTWDAAEPGKGYDAKAAEWRKKLDETSKNQNAETPKP